MDSLFHVNNEVDLFLLLDSNVYPLNYTLRRLEGQFIVRLISYRKLQDTETKN